MIGSNYKTETKYNKFFYENKISTQVNYTLIIHLKNQLRNLKLIFFLIS